MKNTKSHKGQDPAFLFYTSDFLTGTMLMSNEQVGAYIRLMCLQHQKGRLSEKDMLNICKTYDEDVFQKFTKDEHGLYFNERLQFEIQRRIEYSKSRSENRKHKDISKTYVPHMENENENENENVTQTIDTVTISEEGKSKKFIPPTLEQVKEYFSENGYQEVAAIKAYEHYNLANWHDARGNKVRAWKQKMHTNWFKDEYKINGSVVYLQSLEQIREKYRNRKKVEGDEW